MLFMDSNEVGLYRLAASVPELSIAALISWQSSQTHLKRATETINNERVCKAFSEKRSKRRGENQHCYSISRKSSWRTGVCSIPFLDQDKVHAHCTMNIPYYVLQEGMESSTFPDMINSISTGNPQKCSKLYIISLKSNEDSLYISDNFSKGKA